MFRLLRVANSGSLRPLLFVSTVLKGPQTFPQSACASFSTFAYQSPGKSRMSFSGVRAKVSWILDLCISESKNGLGCLKPLKFHKKISKIHRYFC